MLEILAIVLCCTAIGKILRRKGRKPLIFQILLCVSWFAGQFIAGFTYGLVLAIRNGGQPADFDFGIYLVALIGAACAAGFWFLVAHLLPPAGSEYAKPAYGTMSGSQAPPTFGPPSDPNNPYAPPRSRN